MAVASRPAGGSLPGVVGLLLVLPAGLALLVGYAWPTIRTIWLSFRSYTPLGPADGGFVGMENYQRVTSNDDWLDSFWFALSLALPLILVLVVIAPLLAVAAHYAGRPVRLAVRLALAIPMVCFVPVALALAWRFDRFLADPDSAPGAVRGAVWLSMFGLVCGLGVTFYLAAFRRRANGVPWAAAGTVAGLAVIASVAIALQAFTYPYAMTGGGPARSTVTPMLDAFMSGMQRLDFSFAAAMAMLVLIPLMLLGLGAALLVIMTGLRVEVAEPEQPPGWGPVRVTALVGAGLALAAVLVVALYGMWPWLTQLGFGRTEHAGSVATMLARTWLPPIVSTVVGVGLAAVAAFGIGAVRPLGRWSELLLLPFAPWLFVGVGPLFVVKYDSAVSGPIDRIDNLLGWIPPVWLVVPALFLFTLLFRGLALRPSPSAQVMPYRGGPRYGRMVLWSLPMVALVALATWLVQSQSLLWALLVSSREPPAPVWLLQRSGRFGAQFDDIGYGLVLPVPLILLLAIAVGVAQVFYLDRLALRTDRP